MVQKNNKNNYIAMDSSNGAVIACDDTIITASKQITYPDATCSKCNKFGQIAILYNWSKENNLERNICKECHTEALDKFYGLGRNIHTEKILYGKKDK